MALHPAIVHFPIALLITAGIAWIAAIWQKAPKFREFGFWLHTLGLLGVGAAIVSGNLAIPLALTEEGQKTLDYHQTLGYVIAWVFSMLWIWIFMRLSLMGKGETMAFTGVYWVCLSFVIWTAWLGGELVYQHGAGVST